MNLGGVRGRRQVTVLYTVLADQSEPFKDLRSEQISELVTNVQTMVAGILAKYGGCVDRFDFEAVVAVFGLPDPHEDDAMRAILAAEEIHEAVVQLGESGQGGQYSVLSPRSGIDTGVVEITGRGDLSSDRVIGVPFKQACLFARQGKAGAILASPSTCRLAQRRFRFEGLETAVSEE